MYSLNRTRIVGSYDTLEHYFKYVNVVESLRTRAQRLLVTNIETTADGQRGCRASQQTRQEHGGVWMQEVSEG